MKRVLLLLSGVVFLVALIISFYFRSDRNQFLKAALNNFLAANPSVRWQAREGLVTIEQFILAPLSVFLWKDDKLPSVSLFITPVDLGKLEENLPFDKYHSFLGQQYKESVPAVLKDTDGRLHQAQVRFRGDNYIHWAFRKKSWRVEILDSNYDGMQVFNLIIPEDGKFVQELFSMRLAKRLNLITPKAYFITMSLNGGPKQLYLMVEHRSKIMVERNSRPEGNLIGESNLVTPYESVHGVQVYDTVEGDFFDLAAVDFLWELLKDPDNEKFNRLLPTVIDIDATLRWIAHSTVLFSRTQKDSHNFLAYMNTATGKIEPVPWNAIMSDLEPSASEIDAPYNSLVTRILENSEWRRKRDTYVRQLLGDHNRLSEDLSWIDRIRESIRPAVVNDSQRLFLVLEFESISDQFKNRYTDAFTKLTSEIHE